MKVLIVGCERSGTSAISNLIHLSSSLNSILDDPRYTWYLYPLIRVSNNFWSWRLFRDINTYDVVKVPGFATILFFLRKISIRKFKVIYVVRDPRDNVSSIIERLNVSYSGLFLNIEWLGVSGKSVVENLAKRWNCYLVKALEFQSKYPNRIKFIKYEDFYNDPSKMFEEISEFLSIRLDKEVIMKNVRTQFRKNWSNDIRGSKRYKQDLNREEIRIIQKVNLKLMERFDYKIDAL